MVQEMDHMDIQEMVQLVVMVGVIVKIYIIIYAYT